MNPVRSLRHIYIHLPLALFYSIDSLTMHLSYPLLAMGVVASAAGLKERGTAAIQGYTSVRL